MFLWGTPRENGGLLQDKENKRVGVFSDGRFSLSYAEKSSGFLFLYIFRSFRGIRFVCFVVRGGCEKYLPQRWKGSSRGDVHFDQ